MIKDFRFEDRISLILKESPQLHKIIKENIQQKINYLQALDIVDKLLFTIHYSLVIGS